MKTKTEIIAQYRALRDEIFKGMEIPYNLHEDIGKGLTLITKAFDSWEEHT